MPMIRALRMLNAIESGTINGAALETLLADPGRFSEWSVLAGIRSQVQRMLASPITVDAICASPRAVGALLANPRAEAVLYAKASLAVLAPSAWGVYAPRVESFELGGVNANEVMRWRNATGIANRDMLQATSANCPLLGGDNSPLGGMPTLRFSSAALTRLQSTEAFNQPTAYTAFVVYRRSNAGSHGLLGSDIGGGSGVGVRNTSTPTYADGSLLREFSNTAGVNGAWALGRYRRQSAGALYHGLNGGSDSNAVTTEIPSFTGNTGIGFGRLQSGNHHLDGNIAEVWLLAGNGDATSPEVVRVTNLLKHKYKL